MGVQEVLQQCMLQDLFPDSSRPSTECGLGNEAINIIWDDNLSVCSPEITCGTLQCIAC